MYVSAFKKTQCFTYFLQMKSLDKILCQTKPIILNPNFVSRKVCFYHEGNSKPIYDFIAHYVLYFIKINRKAQLVLRIFCLMQI